jgi:hypothetical protein
VNNLPVISGEELGSVAQGCLPPGRSVELLLSDTQPPNLTETYQNLHAGEVT